MSLDEILFTYPELAEMWNYFACIMSVFFIWGIIEVAFKFVVNVFCGKTFFGKNDYRLERYVK